MKIKFDSIDSKPYKIIINPINNSLICGDIKSKKCIKRKSFFSFDYDKEFEKTLNINDNSFFFCIWLDKYPTSILSEQICVGKSYWTIVNENLLEWKLSDKNKLIEFRNYILENYNKD